MVDYSGMPMFGILPTLRFGLGKFVIKGHVS
ncbi:hypothetical protein J2Z65_002305 [Paenibacillus aceris]|uniref:Uncharacterized protein n=1 Tax=Paenibacillus aceris TaxID=869555 RepID=A0ABS4HWR5_9BACL|nr:hypothetical protein [Paenibacillus aceris]